VVDFDPGPVRTSIFEGEIWKADMFPRFMNLGNPPRMLATADPGTSDILPADDTSWEQGVGSRFRVNISQSDRLFSFYHRANLRP